MKRTLQILTLCAALFFCKNLQAQIEDDFQTQVSSTYTNFTELERSALKSFNPFSTTDYVFNVPDKYEKRSGGASIPLVMLGSGLGYFGANMILFGSLDNANLVGLIGTMVVSALTTAIVNSGSKSKYRDSEREEKVDDKKSYDKKDNLGIDEYLKDSDEEESDENIKKNKLTDNEE